MRFGDPIVREAYRRGARDAFDSMIVGLSAPDARALEEWLDDLDAWQVGAPPPPLVIYGDTWEYP